MDIYFYLDFFPYEIYASYKGYQTTTKFAECLSIERLCLLTPNLILQFIFNENLNE